MQEKQNIQIGQHSLIGENVTLGNHVVIGEYCIIENNVTIGDDVYIDHHTIVRNDVKLGANSVVGANCILGEYQMDFFRDRQYHRHPLLIGNHAIIRSGSVLYSGSIIGANFQTGHHATVRENSIIKDHVSIGTFTDVQGKCEIGNYSRLHSNVFVSQFAKIGNCCWIFPHVVLTNDPTPPSNTEWCVHIHSFAIVAANSTVLPGIEIFSDSLIGAGTVVTKNVEKYSVVVGNPGKCIGDIREVKNRETGEKYYPWRHHFDRAMPWENYGFDQWVGTLDEDMRNILL